MKKQSKVFKTIDKIISFILIAFIVIAGFSSLFFTYHKAQNKIVNIFGYSVYYVVTGSMEPYLEVGDVLLIKKTAAENIDEQDIITYQTTQGVLSGNFITHRVIKKNYVGENIVFVTKGDANSVADTEIITEQKIKGVFVRKIAIIKFLMSILSNVWNFLIFIILPLVVSLAMQLVDVVVQIRKKKE
ncbi:MAG: signal peptidase I [Tenericutes bacterium HGW-Tenericutes-4]|nr:MAG: signal peptidase I [Tenericutes bacterium HGW-Tenericutes-4]